jgi:hypothetical protein
MTANLNLSHRTGAARMGARDPQLEYRSPRARRRAAMAELKQFLRKLARARGLTGPLESLMLSTEDRDLVDAEAARLGWKWGLV